LETRLTVNLPSTVLDGLGKGKSAVNVPECSVSKVKWNPTVQVAAHEWRDFLPGRDRLDAENHRLSCPDSLQERKTTGFPVLTECGSGKPSPFPS
jgi:hypothetical protein